MPTAIIFVVDDDLPVLVALRRLLTIAGYEVETFNSAESYLDSVAPQQPGCLLLDVALPGLSGLQMQEMLLGSPGERPIIFLTGRSDIHASVLAMKRGAVDFLTKPVDEKKLLDVVAAAITLDTERRRERVTRVEVYRRLCRLTRREKEVFHHVVHGRMNKQIAADLGTGEKTVKVHRARVMEKMQVRTVAELVFQAVVAGVANPAMQLRSTSPPLKGDPTLFASAPRASVGLHRI
jgi:FixJ family two-component response regulator